MTITHQLRENIADTIANPAVKSSGEKSPRVAINFGSDDIRICTECKSGMRITRRSPHPIYGLAFELQTFTCRICKGESKRSADSAGEVTIPIATPPMPAPPMVIADEETNEQLDRALDELMRELQWINDFIECLTFAIEDMVRKG